MYKVFISPSATDDVKKASKWYNKQKLGLGKKFVTSIRSTMVYIKENPYIAKIRFDDVHVVVVKQFPFSIHYKIKEELKTILIHAVLHDSRNPDLWSDRANK